MYAQLNDNNKTTPDNINISPRRDVPRININISSKTMTKKNNNVELETSLIGNGNSNGNSNGSVNGNDNSNGNDNDNDDDPFYVFREDLEMKLELVNDALSRFERIIQITVSVKS